jgi:hypothetical protein
MRRLAVFAGMMALAAALAACSSSSSSGTMAAKATPTAMSGTETITAVSSGKTAAHMLASNSNAPLTFPKLVLTGPVTTSVSPFALGGPSKGQATFKTPAGNLVVTHSSGNSGSGKAVWTRSGNVCTFHQVFSKGTYVVDGAKSTGKFAGATGSGTFTISAVAPMDLMHGQTKCTAKDTGNPMASGTAVTFHASGPLTVKH